MITRSRRRGVAILLVMGSILVISAILMEIISRSRTSAGIVANRRDGEKAYELARAAVRWGIFRLQLDSALDKVPPIPNTNYGGEKDDLTEVQWAIPLPYPFSPEMLMKAEEGAPPAPQVDIGGTFVSAMTDESSKINLNDVNSSGPAGTKYWSAAALVLQNLLLLPRFQAILKSQDSRPVIYAIDDWTDADSEINHLSGGVEDIEYSTGQPDFHVKNAPFFSVEELRLLKPITDELYRELRPFVTVYPFDARLQRVSTFAGTVNGKVNINTAPLELIAALFNRALMADPRQRLECAQKVVRYRKNVVFRSAAGTEPNFRSAVKQLCGQNPQPGQPDIVEPAITTILDVKSNTFSVEATGLVGDTEKTIHAVVSRQNMLQPQVLYWRVI